MYDYKLILRIQELYKEVMMSDESETKAIEQLVNTLNELHHHRSWDSSATVDLTHQPKWWGILKYKLFKAYYKIKL